MVPLSLDGPGKWASSDAIPGKMETCFENGFCQSLVSDTAKVFAERSEEFAAAIEKTPSSFRHAAENWMFSSTSTSVISELPMSPEHVSVGSALHGIGQCLPCAWAWRPNGCKAGSSCNYCHLCPDGELKRRKKEKIAAIRAGERMAAVHARSGSGAASRQLRN
jgi:hypothetical protein